MTTSFESQHPRTADGTFDTKLQSAPELTIGPRPDVSFDLARLNIDERKALHNHLADRPYPRGSDRRTYGEIYQGEGVTGVAQVLSEGNDELTWMLTSDGLNLPIPEYVARSIDLPDLSGEKTKAYRARRDADAAVTESLAAQRGASSPESAGRTQTAMIAYLESEVAFAEVLVSEAAENEAVALRARANRSDVEIALAPAESPTVQRHRDAVRNLEDRRAALAGWL